MEFMCFHAKIPPLAHPNLRKENSVLSSRKIQDFVTFNDLLGGFMYVQFQIPKSLTCRVNLKSYSVLYFVFKSLRILRCN